MSRTMRIVVALIVVGVVVGVAATAYIYVSGGSGEASGVISAPTLAPDATTETSADGENASADHRRLFELVSEESEVRFGLNEELRGQPTRVIGRTDQVAGQVLVDFESPADSEVGTIRINVRTLMTDQEMRNRTIRGQILQSSQDEFEFSEFQPTAIEDMPDSITMGEPFTFTLIGDLTVRDITNSVTWDVTITPVSEDEITGLATAQVMRADYNLIIPSVPSVANVSEEVDLEIEFTARAVDAGA